MVTSLVLRRLLPSSVTTAATLRYFNWLRVKLSDIIFRQFLSPVAANGGKYLYFLVVLTTLEFQTVTLSKMHTLLTHSEENSYNSNTCFVRSEISVIVLRILN